MDEKIRETTGNIPGTMAAAIEPPLIDLPSSPAATPADAFRAMSESPVEPSPPAAESGGTLEKRIAAVGLRLGATLPPVLDALPGAPLRPQELARKLGIDKVLASRVLKAARHRDPMAITYLAPGPPPLRRLLRAAGKQGAPAQLVDAALAAVDDFENLIRQEAGDRSAFDAIICSWLPDAKAQFELRRKQAAFRAMSELKGSRVDINGATVLLHPSEDGRHIDVVWLMGLIGLTRLRPDVTVKLASRRLAEADTPRTTVTLAGDPIDGMNGVRLDQFCNAHPAELDMQRVGQTTHYTLGGDRYGPRSEMDLILGEVNLAELPRYVPRDSGRKGNFFAEVATPAKLLIFDVLVHEGIYPGADPELLIYDTVLDGVADVNDRTRDIDRLDLSESIGSLGRGAKMFRVANMPQYNELITHVFNSLQWDDEAFRGYRCRIDYPLYGSQVVMAFTPPAPPDELP